MKKKIDIPDNVKNKCAEVCMAIDNAMKLNTEVNEEIHSRKWLIFKRTRYRLNQEIYESVKNVAGISVTTTEVLRLTYFELSLYADEEGFKPEQLYNNPFYIQKNHYGFFCESLNHLIKQDSQNVYLDEDEAIYYNRLVKSCESNSNKKNNTSSKHKETANGK